MLIVDSLPKVNIDGIEKVKLDCAGIDNKGNELPGCADIAFVEQNFNLTGKEIPLSDIDYQILLDSSDGVWKRNWQKWRSEGLI